MRADTAHSTLKSDAAAHLAHDPVLLPHQHLPEDIERLFPEAIADPPRRDEEDFDPVHEIQDPVPAFQRERDLESTTGAKKTRRERLPLEPDRNDVDSICIASGCEGIH